MQPFLFNTLHVRNFAGSTKRKLSFKNVSNVVIQLLHSIKYSIDVPFANMAMVGGGGGVAGAGAGLLAGYAAANHAASAAESPFSKKVNCF